MNDLKGIIIPLGLAAGMFYAAKSLFGGKSEEEKQLDQAIEQGIEQAQAQGQVLSYPPAQYEIYASQVWNSLRFSAISDDKAAAEAVLREMQNNLDVLQLAKSYGTRQLYLFGIPDGPPRNLGETIRSEFSQSRINSVNADYTAKGITLKF